MNSPSKDISMRFMTFSDAILGTAVKEYSLLHNFFSRAYFIHAIAASVAYPLFQNLSDIRQPISHPGEKRNVESKAMEPYITNKFTCFLNFNSI